MDSLEYRELLRHPKWQRKRLRIFDRDQWKCVACGEDDQELHVHHTYYAAGKKPWEYPDNDLVTFCWECHERFHYAESREGIVIPWVSWEVESRCIDYGAVLLYEGREDRGHDDVYLVSTFDGIQSTISCGGAAYFKNPGFRGMQFIHWAIAKQDECVKRWEIEDPELVMVEKQSSV